VAAVAAALLAVIVAVVLRLSVVHAPQRVLMQALHCKTPLERSSR
jgi:hypothetical protein